MQMTRPKRISGVGRSSMLLRLAWQSNWMDANFHPLVLFRNNCITPFVFLEAACLMTLEEHVQGPTTIGIRRCTYHPEWVPSVTLSRALWEATAERWELSTEHWVLSTEPTERWSLYLALKITEHSSSPRPFLHPCLYLSTLGRLEYQIHTYAKSKKNCFYSLRGLPLPTTA